MLSRHIHPCGRPNAPSVPSFYVRSTSQQDFRLCARCLFKIFAGSVPSTNPQVFRQNKRATDVHDIIGFRIIVVPERHGSRASGASATSGAGAGEVQSEGGGKEKEGGKGQENIEHGSSKSRPRERGGRSKPARTVFTIKTFPPPYRDADSRLLHDVYEVLVGLFDEVPGRYKVGQLV